MKYATFKNRLSYKIETHPEDSTTMIPTHTPLQASTATGAIMESTAEARLTFRHKLKNFPQEMFQGHVLPSLARQKLWAWEFYAITDVW